MAIIMCHDSLVLHYWPTGHKTSVVYLGLYLAEKQLSKLPTTIILLKHALETLCVLWIHGEI